MSNLQFAIACSAKESAMPISTLAALVCLPLKALPPGRRRRRLRERRSLAGLVAGLLLFALGSAGLYLLLHTSLAHWRDPFYARRLACLRRRALAPERPRTVVMLGSSRWWCGLRAASLEKQLKQDQPGP